MTTTRALGPNRVFPLALGCMGMSPGVYGMSDEKESIATIHAAVDAGINVIDTGDFYGMGHNELLIRRALEGRRDKVLLSVKFGAMRGPDHSWGGVDTRPAAIKNFLAYSLTRLGIDHIDIYRPARLDPTVPIEDTIGGIAEMIKGGWVRQIGLSEVGVETIRHTQAVHPISDLQIEYSVVSRSPKQKIFPYLADAGIGVTAYGVLSRGLLSGSKLQEKGDWRGRLPRFSGENLQRNQALVAALDRIAVDKGLKTAQLAIAWALHKWPMIVPVIGARMRAQLADALAALEVTLTPEEIARIEAAAPVDAVAGTRYD